MRVQQTTGSFALCVEDGGMEDLEARKVYQVLPDREASREGCVRVIDESGEDYMYPSDLFVPVKLPAVWFGDSNGELQRDQPRRGVRFDERTDAVNGSQPARAHRTPAPISWK